MGSVINLNVAKVKQAERCAFKAFKRFQKTGNVAAHYSRVLRIEKATRTVLGHLTA